APPPAAPGGGPPTLPLGPSGKPGPQDLMVYRTLPATQGDVYRLGRLLWVFVALVAVLLAPLLIGRVQYALTSAKERARLDVARERLVDFQLEQLSTAYRLLFNKVSPSVVNISTRDGETLKGQGSGVIVDEEGYIVTNYHVVEGEDTADVQLSDGRRGSASVVGVDPLIDIAVLKTTLDDLAPADWGDSDELDVGEMVWAVGSPFGLEKSITSGILSAKERRGITRAVVQEFLQTDAAVNPGNSGGPLVDIEGKVVGINTAIVGPTYQGISFAIPSEQARESYLQLRDHGYVERGFLGVRPSRVPDRMARQLGLERGRGVLVEMVDPATPAEDAGLERGDVVLSWNGQAFGDPIQLSQAIAATPIGSEATLLVVRPGRSEPKQLELLVKVGARPTDLQRSAR
ncbi:MAG: trypsin-like peptidase domain-containing protein, partial [Planctomycetota bacterium]